MGKQFPWRGARRLRILGGLTASLLALPGAGSLLAQTSPAVMPPASCAPAEVPVRDLAACRQIALQRQPFVAAYQSSLAAAEARYRAVNDLGVPAFLRRDLPARRQQSCLGVAIARAGLAQAEYDALYAVTRNYFSVLYANQQLELADQAVSNLKDLQETLQKIIDDALRKDVTTRHVDKVKLVLQLVQARREEAATGLQRAAAALREAMGVEPDCPLALADSRLPAVHVDVDRCRVLALAQERRGEIAQASLAARVTGLEVKAQGATVLPTARTFAAGSDIHAKPVPAGSRGADYVPEALGPEMPGLMVGSRAARQEQAKAYEARAGAVADKTRQLILLEAEDSYYKWLEARDKLAKLGPTLELAEKNFKNVREDFKDPALKTTTDDLVNAGILLTQVRVQVNEAQYQLLLALAALERITAGGLCPWDAGAAGPKP